VTRPANSQPPVVELNRVSRQYSGPPAVTALREATLTIGAGDYVAMVGRSGSGKSTLVNIIGLLDRPTGGQYWLNGADTGLLSAKQRAILRGTRVGIVFQAFHLMNWRPAIDNVALAGMYAGIPLAIRRATAAEALRLVGLGHRLNALPSTLSGGECQRVAIARALALDPSLLLCDEPTGSLDSVSADIVLGLLAKLNDAGVTILVITHDPVVAAHARRTISIADGVVRGVAEQASC
jgi:putative ABC transport system ATP-binding protein